MDEKPIACPKDELDESSTDKEVVYFTAAVYKPIDFTTDDEAMDYTVDHKPIDLSAPERPTPGPIDLTTIRSKTSDQGECSKLLSSCSTLKSDVQEPLSLYSEADSTNSESRLPKLPLEIGLLSSPLENELGAPCRNTYSPPLLQAPPSPADSLESPSALLSSSPRRESPGLDTSTDEQDANKRYSSSSRLFNILAKKYIGDIDCPPRPGHRQGAAKSCGEGTHGKDDSESDAAYRERRSKNNLAARRSRDKRKMKCDLLLQKTLQFKQEAIDILKEIKDMQKIMSDRGFTQPFPCQDEINFVREELSLFS